jgi:predicted nuclease of predicted toxin-antitoxin system
MRILLDESLPRDLAPLLVGHEVTTVASAGWSGIKNGILLALAASRFDAFITADRDLEFQQNLATLPIAVVVLHVPRTRIQAIEPVIPQLLKLLNHLPAKALRRVAPG